MDFDIWGILWILLRWMHILAAITAVGGTIFARLALVPSLSVLNEESRGKLHEAIRDHWARPVQLSITFLIVSGVFNIIRIEKAYEVSSVPYYHPVFGIKFLLALAVFFLASALTGRSKGTQRFRDNRRYWLTVNMVLAIVIVCLSGILRMSQPRAKGSLSAVRPAVISTTPLAISQFQQDFCHSRSAQLG